MTGIDALLDARGVTCDYGRRRVLHGIDLTLGRGEMVALLGPNGSGKTTLMKVLVGLLSAAAGTVTGPSGRAVGWVPQGGAIYARLSVRENLELFARLMRLPGDHAQIARDAAHDASLEPWFEHQGGELSGGLRQRLNVAVGLLGDPTLLVLDEPTTGVDLAHRTVMFDVLRRRTDGGCTVLFSTHAVEDAARADRSVVLVDGRSVWEGPLAEVADVPGEDPAREARLDPVSAGLLRLWAQAEGAPT